MCQGPRDMRRGPGAAGHVLTGMSWRAAAGGPGGRASQRDRARQAAEGAQDLLDADDELVGALRAQGGVELEAVVDELDEAARHAGQLAAERGGRAADLG